MIYSSIYRDTYYTTTADSLNYKIELDGNIIYYGRAVKFPDADTMKININKVCRDYLSSNIDLILNGASAQTNTTALRVFTLTNTLTNQVLEQYTFLYDWNYVELWTGQTQNRYYKDGDTPVSNYITVTPASLNNIPSTGGSFTITVNSNVPWRTNSTGVYPSTGNAGSTTVTISIGENPYDIRYSGSKTFYMAGDTSVQATFRYFQDAESTTGTTVDVYPTSLSNIPSTGGTYTITVYSNGDWSTSVPSWINVNPQTGSGNGTITVTVPPNYGGARDAVVSVVTANDMASVILSQEASSQEDYITVTPSEVRNVPASGGSYEFTLVSNVPWKNAYNSLHNVYPTGGTAGRYTVTITQPSTENPRESYYYFIKDGDSSVQAMVKIYQNAQTLSVYPEVLSNADSGGTTYTIDITTNDDWNITVPEWATVSSSSGTGSGTVTVTVGDNTGTTRSGNVVISTNEDSKTLSVTQYGETVDTTEYFTVEFISGGSINFAAPSSADSLTMYYSRNYGEWTNITSSLGSVVLLYGNAGDRIRFKGTDYFRTISNVSNKGIIYNSSQDSSTKVRIYGNIMSTVYGDNFADKTTVSSNMFRGCFWGLNVVDASELILPATTLAEDCYSWMFLNCRYLTKAPELPATALANGCYSYMFSNCESLVQVPVLPATTLAERCYLSMFDWCSSLTTAPALPATTIAYDCYAYMFRGCTSLTQAPALPATTLGYSCYREMFRDCTSLTTAPSILPATTLTIGCYLAMFGNCSELTTAPELPATVLIDSCYSGMFSGCTNLNYIKCLATDISAFRCTADWVDGVASAGTFVKDISMADWLIDNVNGIPSGWTIENEGVDYSQIPLTFEILSDGNIVWKTDSSKYSSTIEYSKDSGNTWTSITSTTAGIAISVVSGDTVQFRGDNTAYNFAVGGNNFTDSTVSFKLCGNIMSLIDSTNFSGLTTLTKNRTFTNLFSSCSALTDASNLVLPATTLTNSCYANMFANCTSLTTAPALPATTLADSCYYSMFFNTGLRTAPTLPATALAEYCYQYMFKYCANLNYVKCLATDLSATNCTLGWLASVAPTGTFVKDANMNYWGIGIDGIPNNWTVENNS